MISPKDLLDDLLTEDAETARARAGRLFDELRKERPVILVGAGMLGQKCLRALKENNIDVPCFVDNNPARWGRYIDDTLVASAQSAANRFGNEALFVVSIWAPRHKYEETKKRLESFGVKSIVHFQALLWKYPSSTLPHYQFQTPDYYLQKSKEILSAFDILSDDTSRHIYSAYMHWRLRLRLEPAIKSSLDDQYFPQGLYSVNAEEVFVDCGAYDGDTIRQLLWRRCEDFSHIYAYEPDPVNFRRLADFVAELPLELSKRIHTKQAAVSNCSGFASFEAPGATRAALSNSGDIKVEVIKLDDEPCASSATFLKFDVEGAEFDALSGSKEIIEAKRPILAVCLYHNPQDIYELPLFIDEMCDDYSYHIRIHDEDGLEMVFYAIPRERSPLT